MNIETNSSSAKKLRKRTNEDLVSNDDAKTADAQNESAKLQAFDGTTLKFSKANKDL